MNEEEKKKDRSSYYWRWHPIHLEASLTPSPKQKQQKSMTSSDLKTAESIETQVYIYSMLSFYFCVRHAWLSWFK